MYIPLLLDHCKEVLGQWEENYVSIPAKKILSAYFKERKYLGSKDRRFIFNNFWLAVRRRHVYKKHYKKSGIQGDQTSFHCLLAYKEKGYEDPAFRDADPLKPLYFEMKEKALFDALNLDVNGMFPVFLGNALKTYLDSDTVSKTLKSLSEESSVHLRLNSLKCDERQLRKEMPDLQKGKIAPNAWRLLQRKNLASHSVIKKGQVEIQDESSQLISYLVSPKPDDLVIDATAGAGGKTLHLSALMQNKGHIVASDISPRRLEILRQRAKTAGCTNIRTSPPSSLFSKYTGKADIVLIDAPCSGTGTLKRQPDLIYRQKRSWQKKLQASQKRILSGYEKLLKPGGVLVYSTCSLLPEENQNQIDAFLKTFPNYKPENACAFLRKKNIEIEEILAPYLLILPQMVDSDGFFAARLRKGKE